MYITKEAEKYILCQTPSQNSYCKILPPVLVMDGREIAASAEDSASSYRIHGIVISDELQEIGGGIFSATRQITNQNDFPVRFKSIFEVNTAFVPRHFVFPGFNYDTSQCGAGAQAGEIINTTKAGLQSSVLNTPTGLEKDGQPWVFAYDREGIPSATLSENEEKVVALFASDKDRLSLESCCSMIKNADGTFRHRLIHPISEMPYTYAQKNSLEAPMETELTLQAKEEITLSFYLFVGEPKYPNYGMANLLEACTEVFPFTETPALTQKEVWELGISYFRFLQKDAGGVPMFSGHISDRLFQMAHAGELKGEALAKAMEIPENRTLSTFSTSYEIGWAGQGAMVARLFAENGYRIGSEQDVKTAEACLDAYVATQHKSGLLYPLYAHNKLPEDRRRLPDACNMGWAMCELMRSFKLFRDHGTLKQNYYDFSVRLADFAVRTYSDEYGFAKTWQIDGTPVSTHGSIGGFMIMGLCEVYKETKDPRYLDTAKKAMDFYYARDLDHFVCTAGAIDCACIDKETAYPFLESALFLYEQTKEQIWLERAEKAAYYFFSWLFFYDALYDEDSDFARFGYHTTGGTLISAEHSALDAWGALTVECMMRLWHLTGNDRFLTFARMTWWNALLAIATEDTPPIHGNKRPAGSQNEGFFHCRWTKYRPTCEERGHFNDNLQSWMGAWRLYTINALSEGDLNLLWGGKQ